MKITVLARRNSGRTNGIGVQIEISEETIKKAKDFSFAGHEGIITFKSLKWNDFSSLEVERLMRIGMSEEQDDCFFEIIKSIQEQLVSAIWFTSWVDGCYTMGINPLPAIRKKWGIKACFEYSSGNVELKSNEFLVQNSSGIVTLY